MIEQGQRNTNLVENSSCTESRDVVGRRLDNGPKDIEEDRDEDQLNTTEDICNFGGGWLTNGGDDTANDVDGG